MVLMMACELTFSTPAERGTFKLPAVGLVKQRAVGRGDTQPPPSSAVSFFFATRLGSSWHRLGFWAS